MDKIKIRYVWKRKRDDLIWMEIAPIECVEGNGDTPFILHNNSLFDLISRDLFTGLKDKNGKDMIEGDIIRYCYHVNKPPKDFVMVIEYHTKTLEIGWEHDETMFCGFILKGIDENSEDGVWYTDIPVIEDIEIIGNIHENKELLK